MIIYVEKSLEKNTLAQEICETYKNSEVLYIKNYKNIFDKSLGGKTSKTLVLAEVRNPISVAPSLYGHPGGAFFFKNSLNCVFDCNYCYLQGAFRNNQNVFFLNYEHIKKEILAILQSSKQSLNRFYSSDYSDNLATDNLTHFTQEFIPFFNSLQNAKMEIRTKSTNIKALLNMKPSKNVEIAFSLNPSELIEEHERLTSSLNERILAVNTLLDAGWQVGLRFMPLIKCKNYEVVYDTFLDKIVKNIDIAKIYSIFIGGLLYTHKDYNIMLKKQPYLRILHQLEKSNSDYYREDLTFRKFIYDLFNKKIQTQKNTVCMDCLA